MKATINKQSSNMKRNYQKPAMQVVNITISNQLLTSSKIGSIGGNSELHGAGAGGSITGGSDTGRSRSSSDWDDEYID